MSSTEPGSTLPESDGDDGPPTGHVVLVADERFSVGCAATLQSILDNCSTPLRLHIHVVTTGLSEETLRELKRATDVVSAGLSIHAFDVRPVRHLLRSKEVNHLSYARLFLADVLPSDAGRAVYVDTDVIFQKDILELIDLPLEGKTVGAVPNGSEADAAAQWERLGKPATGYFNAGIMAVDVPSWRAEEVGSGALAVADRMGDRLILWDQDALNLVLRGRWYALEGEWNSVARQTSEGQGRVLHFTMSPKPWDPDYRGPHADRFFHYLNRTSLADRVPRNPGPVDVLLQRIWRRVPYPPTVCRKLLDAVGLGEDEPDGE